MVRIIMHGCNGHMGQVITGIVKEDKDAEIVAGIDLVDNRDNGYPVFKSLKDCDVEADVVIDFASAKAEDALIEPAWRKSFRLLICTTGLRGAACQNPRGFQGSSSSQIRQHVPGGEYPLKASAGRSQSAGSGWF